MISKSLRIKKEHFLHNKTKLYYRGDLFDVAYFPTITENRISVVVAKKRLKKAVDRNKIKRITYEAVRVVNHPLSKAVVIYPKVPLLTTPFTTICSQIRSLFDTLV